MPSSRADELLHARVDVVVGADGAADLADGGLVGGLRETVEVAAHLERPDAELHAERDRLGVDAVRAADLHGVPELERPPLEHLPEGRRVALEQLAGELDLQRQAGVEHVAAGHAVVDEPRGLTDVLCHVRKEGDDVVVGRLLYLADAGDVESGLDSISVTASSGTLPSSAHAFTAAISTSSQARILASSVQTAPISGSV